MRHQVRVVAKGYFGEPSPEALTFFSSSQTAADKKSRQVLKNLVSLADAGLSGDIACPPLVLNSTLVWPAEFNNTDFWTPQAADYLENRGTAFRAGAAVEHTNITASAYQSGNGLILDNTPWGIRFYLNEPGIEHHFFRLRWGGYQFELYKGQPRLMRLSPAWTQGQEETLTALLSVTSITPANQATIDGIIDTIYEDYTDLALGVDADDFYNRPVALQFLPDPSGICYVSLDGNQMVGVANSAIKTTRQEGTLWGDSQLEVRSNAGSYFWQVGYPVFNPIGQKRLGRFKDGQWRDDWSSVVHRQGKSEPADTSIIADREIINSVFSEIVINFATENTRRTPFLYWHSSFIDAGPRVANEDVVFDSDDHPDVHGVGPVVELSTCFEGDDKYVTRRSLLDLELRNVNGELGLPGVHYEALENRLIDVYLDGTLYAGNFLVNHASLANMHAATPNQAHSLVMGPDTRLMLSASDYWALLDEMPMRLDLIGDDMRLGAYLRLHLRGAGFDNYEMSGVSANTGVRLPKPAPGEEPCVRSSEDGMFGDALRSVLERWGMGSTLYLSDGVWQFGVRPQTVVAAFTSDESQHKANSYPGRWHILSPLDLDRDFYEFYNQFVVEGAPDPITGIPITRSATLHESIRRLGGPATKNYIGRPKPYPVVRDSGLRTGTDVQRVLRSIVRARGRLGRFIGFETYFHRGLRPGQIITVDGVKCEIIRIPSLSVAADRMTLVCQEVLF